VNIRKNFIPSSINNIIRQIIVAFILFANGCMTDLDQWSSDDNDTSTDINEPEPLFLDTFENLDNWNAVGWALGHTNFEYWDPPYAYCDDLTDNYLSLDIEVLAGQTLKFQLRVWAYSDPYHAVKLYINNVKINTWYTSGINYDPEIELNYNGSINIKFVANSSDETSGVPAGEARIDNVRVE